jgi:hypothetical protein
MGEANNQMMQERELQELLELAAASLDAEASASSGVPGPSACPGLGRLAELAATAPTPAEAAHLRRCRRCAARRRAFAGRPPPRRRPALGAGALGVGLAAAAAALLVIGVAWWRSPPPAPSPVVGPVEEPVEQPIPVACIENVAPADPAIGGGQVSFLLSADDRCVMVVLLRSWQPDCDCRRWHVHRWGEDQDLHVVLQPGETRSIDLDLAGAPPAQEQLLVVVTAHRLEDLPLAPGEAHALLGCLGASDRCEAPDADAEDCMAAVPGCLQHAQDAVAVIGHPFRVF